MLKSNISYKRVIGISLVLPLLGEMIYETIISPYNRINLDLYILHLDGIHTYEMAFIIFTFIFGILSKTTIAKLILVIPIYVAIHEMIWVSFDIFAYPVMVTLINQFRPTNVLWFMISGLSLYFKPVKFDFESNSFYIVFIIFNLTWWFGFGYVNTLMIMPNGTHPFAFNIAANAFEWAYNIIYTGIFIKVFKWKSN